ncbi:ABC transporter permease [Dietzia sp. MNB45]|uniref:ABC transporter permease n=1 Tax=Dietzia sp. MNB45 TaxID=3238800 RepID=UPI003F81395B
MTHQIRCEALESVKVNKSAFLTIGRRPSLDRYLSSTWRLRYFILSQARYRAFTTGRGTYLGQIWLLVEPLLRVGMYYVIFGLLLNVSRGIDNFIAFLAIGVTIFSPLAAALTSGSTVLNRHRSLVKGFAFPRITLLISDSLRSAYDAIPDALVLLVFIWVVPPHENPQWSWFLLIPLLVVSHIFVTGIMLLTAWISSIIPDIRHLWSIATRFWFYASGVIFPLAMYVKDPTMSLILHANPAAVILTMAREILMDGTVPRLSLWFQLVGWSLAALCFGILLFWSREEAYNNER